MAIRSIVSTGSHWRASARRLRSTWARADSRPSAKGSSGRGETASTPIAIVENGSRADQRVTIATLADLADIAAHGEIRSPALLIVGEVAALAGELHWFGELPRRWLRLDRQAA